MKETLTIEKFEQFGTTEKKVEILKYIENNREKIQLDVKFLKDRYIKELNRFDRFHAEVSEYYKHELEKLDYHQRNFDDKNLVNDYFKEVDKRIKAPYANKGEDFDAVKRSILSEYAIMDLFYYHYGKDVYYSLPEHDISYKVDCLVDFNPVSRLLIQVKSINSLNRLEVVSGSNARNMFENYQYLTERKREKITPQYFHRMFEMKEKFDNPSIVKPVLILYPKTSRSGSEYFDNFGKPSIMMQKKFESLSFGKPKGGGRS